MKKLDLKGCKTNKDVCDRISERVNSVPYEDLIKAVETRFVFQSDTAKAIYTGLSENINVFLSGPGGYGKSSLIKFVLDFYGIPYNIIVGYKDMPVDALLGIPNMDKLLKESKYEVNFSESIFCKPGVLVGEEFADILPSTAAALKDILTERGMQGKDGKTESLISCMIVASNKASIELIDDESKRAFYKERFPLQTQVNWLHHKASDYYKLLSLVFENANQDMLFFMAKLLEDNHVNHNNTISPRIACEITKVYLNKGINFISHFPIDLTDFHAIKADAEKEFNAKSVNALMKDIILSIYAVKPPKEHKLTALYALKQLDKLKVRDDILPIILNTKETIENQILAKPYQDSFLQAIDDLLSLIKDD